MKKKFLFISFIALFALFACEEDITLDLPVGEEQLVVEGFIENGMPPIILLTKTMPYFAKTDINSFSEIYVAGAKMKVSDGSNSVDLMEINFKTLPDSIAAFLSAFLQVPVEELRKLNLVLYTSIQMFGQEGKTYTLTIDKDSHHLKAVTTIPKIVVPDSVWIVPHTDKNNDSLKLVNMSITDPKGDKNFYRYFTQRNNEGYFPNRFRSVFNDALVDGQNLIVPVVRGESRTSQFNQLTYGSFKKGDTVTIKLCAIDSKHYDFWSTFENSVSSGGPYAVPVQIKSNVDGGLGIWGGYGATYFEIVIPQ